MIPLKLIEAVQRRAVIRRLMQDARTFYGPTDSTTPKERIECDDIVPVIHNVVPVTVVHEVVSMLAQLEQFENENIEKFTVVEREPIKVPRITPKENADGSGAGEVHHDGGEKPSRKKPLRGGKGN